MKTKELKNLASKIAKYEMILQDKNCDKKNKLEAQNKIIELSGKVKNLEDILIIDEMVQEILQNS